jgi:predicted phosphoribosyltransferase
MSKILDKVWPSKKTAPKVHIAYAISVCEFLLNPTNKRIQVAMMMESSEKQQECDGDKIIQVEEEEVQEVQEVREEEVEEKESGGIEDYDYFSSEDEKRRAQSLKRKYGKQI